MSLTPVRLGPDFVVNATLAGDQTNLSITTKATAPKSAARPYVRSFKPMHREFDRSRRGSKLFYARPFQPWLWNRLPHSRNVQRLFGRLVTGELTLKHLQTPLVRHSVGAVLSGLRRTLS
jgi:hypothetical protein